MKKPGRPVWSAPADRPTYGRHIVFELAYMSSQTLWAKATGSAGRMPSTSSA